MLCWLLAFLGFGRSGWWIGFGLGEPEIDWSFFLCFSFASLSALSWLWLFEGLSTVHTAWRFFESFFGGGRMEVGLGIRWGGERKEWLDRQTDRQIMDGWLTELVGWVDWVDGCIGGARLHSCLLQVFLYVNNWFFCLLLVGLCCVVLCMVLRLANRLPEWGLERGIWGLLY